MPAKAEAIWATWYDVDPQDGGELVAWMNANYLPFIARLPNVTWAAHYRNVGPGPTLANYHDIAGHAPAAEALAEGSQYVVMAGAPATYDFLSPNVFELALPDGFTAMLGRRRGVRTALLWQEAGVDGPAARGEAGPAPAIQFGTYRVRTQEDEVDLARWYAEERLPLMARMPGCVRSRKFLMSVGWARHGVLYEFESLAARTRQFEVPHESQVTDKKFWTGRIVRTTLHTPGSPVVGERLWPAVAG